MRAPWLLGGALALLAGAGLTLAQETQPSSAPPPPAAPDAPPVVASPPPSDAPPPEEAAPAPRLEHAPVVADEDDKADDTPPEPPPPLKRPRYASAILQGVDKITAETFRFEAKVGEPVRYKGVVLTVHACETTAADEPAPDSWAHLDVASQPRAAPGKRAPAPKPVFRGWMSAASPSLHPFEHPSYDLWLIACKAPAPDTPEAGRA